MGTDRGNRERISFKLPGDQIKDSVKVHIRVRKPRAEKNVAVQR